MRTAPTVRRLARALVVIGVIAAVLAPVAAFAQTDADEEGLLVRVNGDGVIGAEETAGAAIVVRGDLLIEGSVTVAVVVDGNVTVKGGAVDTLVLVRGTANLTEGATVSGDVYLTDATLDDDGTAEVSGSINRDVEGFFVGLWVFGILLAIGLGLLALLGALVFAGVAPDTARSAGAAIRHDFGQVVLAGLGLWIAVPFIAGVLLITIVGIPSAFAVWLGVLPLMGFLGYLVTGIWIGEMIVARDGGIGHPYLAAFLGTLILALVGFIPGFGPLIGTLAALLGSSALALLGWRNFRNGDGEQAEPAPG